MTRANAAQLDKLKKKLDKCRQREDAAIADDDEAKIDKWADRVDEVKAEISLLEKSNGRDSIPPRTPGTPASAGGASSSDDDAATYSAKKAKKAYDFDVYDLKEKIKSKKGPAAKKVRDLINTCKNQRATKDDYVLKDSKILLEAFSVDDETALNEAKVACQPNLVKNDIDLYIRL